MDKILEAKDEIWKEVQRQYHIYMVERKIRKLKKNLEKKITYVNDWLETKLS